MPIRKLIIVKNYSYIPLKVIYIYVFVIYIINALKFVLMCFTPYPTPFVQKLTGELSKGHIAKVINLSTDYARVIER